MNNNKHKINELEQATSTTMNNNKHKRNNWRKQPTSTTSCTSPTGRSEFLPNTTLVSLVSTWSCLWWWFSTILCRYICELFHLTPSLPTMTKVSQLTRPSLFIIVCEPWLFVMVFLPTLSGIFWKSENILKMRSWNIILINCNIMDN